MKALHYSCQGESHKATDKVCQDYSYSEVSDRLAIAIVCDGHGGKRYFRSDVGAKYATEITKKCVTEFIDGVGDELFKGKAFTQVSALNTEIKNENYDKKTKVDVAMRQLFSSIIYRWQENIRFHAYNTPLTDEERSTLAPQYVADFENKESLEKTYGCTLMCYVRTDAFWLAFHLGDGKFIAFNKAGEWSEPIPWDERCFLNKTTSLCDNDALDEFRYCYQGDGEYPPIVFLGSDGIDDSFGETSNMVNFYAQVAKMFATEPFEACVASIESTLPELSVRGSQDDMSVACVYDETILPEVTKGIISWQQCNVLETIRKLNERIEKYGKEYDNYVKRGNLSDKEKIDQQNTLKALKRAYEFKRDQAKMYDRFSQELGLENVEPYSDELGFGEQKILEAENPAIKEMVVDADKQEICENVEEVIAISDSSSEEPSDDLNIEEEVYLSDDSQSDTPEVVDDDGIDSSINASVLFTESGSEETTQNKVQDDATQEDNSIVTVKDLKDE